MILKEFYNQVQGDYEGTISRLCKEDLVKRFVLKFTNDKSFEELLDTFEKKNYEDAFRAVHTLKGLAVNLGFTKLYEECSVLTESLRNVTSSDVDNKMADIKKMIEDIREEYNKTISLINEIDK
ncbi:MAG: Hpt domain-containing protein [Lachnospiraceae bacterium]|nr:Hpt domain-containing protein [Lachnospiraceae bacterium]